MASSNIHFQFPQYQEQTCSTERYLRQYDFSVEKITAELKEHNFVVVQKRTHTSTADRKRESL